MRNPSNPTIDLPAEGVRARIIEAMRKTRPSTPGRRTALARVKWVLSCKGGLAFVALDGAQPYLTPNRDEAEVYDGRDNEAEKVRFFSLMFGEVFTPTLVEDGGAR